MHGGVDKIRCALQNMQSDMLFDAKQEMLCFHIYFSVCLSVGNITRKHLVRFSWLNSQFRLNGIICPWDASFVILIAIMRKENEKDWGGKASASNIKTL